MKHLVKWGIIGLGNIAFEFAKSFQNSENAELIAVASNSKEKLNKFKEKFNIKSSNLYSDYQELIKDKNVDIVYIALPNTFHYKWVLQSIENNKNILVEKPAFINFEETKNIFNHQNFKNIYFSEGYMYRYHPQISKLIKIIDSNEIGKILSMKSNFGINIVYKKSFFGFRKKKLDKNKRIFNKKLGGGVIFDLGCYATSMSLMIGSLINDIELKNFNLTNVETEYLYSNIDVQSHAKINFDNKFTSDIGVSFIKDIGNETVILGELGKVILKNSWGTGNTQLKIFGKKNDEIDFKDSKNIYSLEIENVSKDILNKKKEASFPGIKREETLLNTKIIESWINA